MSQLRSLEEVSFIHENIIKDYIEKRKAKKQYKVDSNALDYLYHLLDLGISKEEFKSKVLPKAKQLHMKISIAIYSYAKSVNIPSGDLFIIAGSDEYDKMLEAVLDFDILKEKDYIMKNLFIADATYDYFHDILRVAENTLGDVDEFRISSGMDHISLSCLDWIYDKKKIESEIKELEAKPKNKE